jgi:hypothetical protein
VTLFSMLPHLKSTSYIQQFHLIIRYKKHNYNKMADFLSQPPTPVLSILEVHCATSDTWKDQYAIDPEFQEILEAFQSSAVINKTPFLDYTISDGWLYKFNFLCIPHSEDRLFLTNEVHASSYGGPLRDHNDHTTSSTPFSLAFYVASS